MSNQHVSRKEFPNSFVLYRQEMYKLLAAPKDSFEQLCFELPCLMSFRTREVCTWRAEYINFDEGHTLVLDAKKKQLFQVPLSISVASHAEKLLNGRSEGYVLRSRSCGGRGRGLDKPLSDVSIWKVWQKHAEKRGFNDHEFSPVVGRRFFAAEWFYGQGLPVATLSKIMRHNDIETTLRYVAHLIFYEDLKTDFLKFETGFAEPKAPPLERVQASLRRA